MKVLRHPEHPEHPPGFATAYPYSVNKTYISHSDVEVVTTVWELNWEFKHSHFIGGEIWGVGGHLPPCYFC